MRLLPPEHGEVESADRLAGPHSRLLLQAEHGEGESADRPAGLRSRRTSGWRGVGIAQDRLPSREVTSGALQVGEVWATPRTACRVER